MKIKEYLCGFCVAFLGFSFDCVIKLSGIPELEQGVPWVAVFMVVFLFACLSYPLISRVVEAHSQGGIYCNSEVGISGCFLAFFLGFWSWAILVLEVDVVKGYFERMIGVGYFIVIEYLV